MTIKPNDPALLYWVALAIAGLAVIVFATPAPAFTTLDDLHSGRFAEDQPPVIVSVPSATSQSQSVRVETPIINLAPTDVPTTNIIDIPENSITTCSMSGGYGSCSNHSLKPDPKGCPPGQVFITMREYGIVSHKCVPE